MILYNAAMDNLSSLTYDRFYGNHKCDCGKDHNFETVCNLSSGAFDSMPEFISGFIPNLSRVAIFYDDEVLKDKILNSVKKEFRTVFIKVNDDKSEIEKISLPEDTKLIIASGGTVNAAKYIAFTLDIPVIVAALPEFFALTSICIVKERGTFSAYKVNKPVGYIFDTDYPVSDKNLAALFGSVAARLNTAFEYYVSYLMSGKEYCPFLAGAISDIAAKTVLSDGVTIPKFKETLLRQALKLSLIGSLDLIEYSGEAQCGLAYELLMPNSYSQGEIQFVFSAVLTKLYLAHLSRRHSFVPPPDNNLRLEQISEIFGISESTAIKSIRPQIGGKEAALFEYKIKEYNFDLIEKLQKNLSLYNMGFKIFKRLYSDDGYSLNELLSGDLSLCIALSPDIIWGEGMLSALKRNGELDAYII